MWAGTYYVSVDTECKDCEKGKFKDTERNKRDQLYRVPQRHDNAQEGQSSCRIVLPGNMSTKPGGKRNNCKVCPAG